MADSYRSILLATILLVLVVSNLFQTQAATNNIITTTSTGFSVDLIHRDSPLSPFYKPSETNLDRLRNAYLRSSARVNNHHLTRKTINIVQSKSSESLIYSGGVYIMNISIGTPPVVIPCIVDTGSDLTWTRCKPCKSCFEQLAPLFDPKQSSTYIEIPCESLPCKAVGKLKNYCTPQNICEYNYSYADGAFTNGRIATETISIGSVSSQDIFFGCGYNNADEFEELGSGGIIALGRGPLSFINQFGPSFGHKFSYCLVPRTSSDSTTGRISFGNDGVVSGDGVVSTPMVTNGLDKSSYYYLALEGVSVGEKRTTLKEEATLLSNNGVVNQNDQKNDNIIIIIDSGSALTYLPKILYDDIEAAMDNAIGGKRIQDPTGFHHLCYQTEKDIDAPIVTFHFSGNADVHLKAENTFVRIMANVVCFTITPASNDVAYYGNLSQVNFLVGYDLDSQTVSFKPTDCTIYGRDQIF